MQTGLVPAAAAAVLIAWAPTQVARIVNPFDDIACALEAGATCADQAAADSGAGDGADDGSDIRLMAAPLAEPSQTARLVLQWEQLASGP